MGSRAVAARVPRRGRGGGQVRGDGRRGRGDLHPHRPLASSTGDRTELLLRRRAGRRRRRPACGTSSTPTGCCSTPRSLPWSLKADELLREQYAAVGAAARARPACRAGRAGARPRRAGSTSPTCWPSARPTRAANADAFTAAYRRVLLAGRRPRRRAAWRRSSCSPPRARPGTTATTCGTWPWPTGWWPPTRDCSGRPGASSSTRGGVGRATAGTRLVGGADRSRRRGHGGQAAGQPDPHTRRGWCSRA